MEARGQEISRPMKQVIVEFYSNVEKVSDIARSVSRSLELFTELLVNFKETGRLKTRRDRADPVPLVIGNIGGYRGSFTVIAWLHLEK